MHSCTLRSDKQGAHPVTARQARGQTSASGQTAKLVGLIGTSAKQSEPDLHLARSFFANVPQVDIDTRSRKYQCGNAASVRLRLSPIVRPSLDRPQARQKHFEARIPIINAACQ